MPGWGKLRPGLKLLWITQPCGLHWWSNDLHQLRNWPRHPFSADISPPYMYVLTNLHFSFSLAHGWPDYAGSCSFCLSEEPPKSSGCRPAALGSWRWTCRCHELVVPHTGAKSHGKWDEIQQLMNVMIKRSAKYLIKMGSGWFLEETTFSFPFGWYLKKKKRNRETGWFYYLMLG